jgi:hypothetical protein
MKVVEGVIMFIIQVLIAIQIMGVEKAKGVRTLKVASVGVEK